MSADAAAIATTTSHVRRRRESVVADAISDWGSDSSDMALIFV
jgi:hypothetical protein